jgi:hypothetical protein
MLNQLLSMLNVVAWNKNYGFANESDKILVFHLWVIIWWISF